MNIPIAQGAVPIDVAVMAKAPVPGLAKTRLIPAMGAIAAARLHRHMVLRTLHTAYSAGLGGAVTLWGAPSLAHPFFRALQRRGVTCREQPSGDLGVRMRHVFTGAITRPVLLIGTDCPAMTAAHLRSAARALTDGFDAAFLPAEDGGYVLVGLRSDAPAALFADVPWGTSDVMAVTRERLMRLRCTWVEPATLWDVDTADDLARLRALRLMRV